MKRVFSKSIRQSSVQSSKRNEGGGKEKVREKELNRAEIRKTIKRLKNGKAAGIDGIPEKLWNYGREDLEKWMWKFYDTIWNRERVGRVKRRNDSTDY